MQAGDIFQKAAAGLAEVKARSRSLAPRMRTLLILVDGTTPAQALVDAGVRIGAPPNALAELLALGLIELKVAAAAAQVPPVIATVGTVTLPQPLPERTADSTVDRFRVAQRFMNDSVVDALGIRAFFFTLKMEKCFTLGDLHALLPEFEKAIAKGKGEGVGKLMTERAQQLLR